MASTNYSNSIEEILQAQQDSRRPALEKFDETYIHFGPGLQTILGLINEMKGNVVAKGLTLELTSWDKSQKDDARYKDFFYLILNPHTGEIYSEVDRTGTRKYREEIFVFNPASESYRNNQAQLLALGISEHVIASLFGFVTADGKTSLVKYLINNGCQALPIDEESLKVKLHDYSERIKKHPIKFDMA